MHAPARNRHDTYAADEAAVRGLHDMVDTLRADRTELVRHYRARQRRLRKAMEAPPPQNQRWGRPHLATHSPSPPPPQPPSPQPASTLDSEIPVPVPEIEPEPEPEPEPNRDVPEQRPPPSPPLAAVAPSPLAAAPAVAAEVPAGVPTVVSSAAAAEVAPRPPSPSPPQSSHPASSPPPPPLSAAASPASPPHHAADARSASDECPSSGPVLAHELCAAVLKRNVISAEYTAEPSAAESAAAAAALAEVVVTPQHAAAAAGRTPAPQQAEETRPRMGAVVAELPPPCLAPSTALSAVGFAAPRPPRLQNSVRDPTVVATLARVAPQTPEPSPPLPLLADEPLLMEEAPPVVASVAVVAAAAEEEIVTEAAPACGECLREGSAVNYCGSCELDVCAQCSKTHPLPYHDLAPLSDWEAAQGEDGDEEEDEEEEEEEEEGTLR